MKNPHDYSGSRSRAATRLRTSIVMAERKKDEQLGVAQEDSGRRGGGRKWSRLRDTCLRKLLASRPREPKVLTTKVTKKRGNPFFPRGHDAASSLGPERHSWRPPWRVRSRRREDPVGGRSLSGPRLGHLASALHWPSLQSSHRACCWGAAAGGAGSEGRASSRALGGCRPLCPRGQWSAASHRVLLARWHGESQFSGASCCTLVLLGA